LTLWKAASSKLSYFFVGQNISCYIILVFITALQKGVSYDLNVKA